MFSGPNYQLGGILKSEKPDFPSRILLACISCITRYNLVKSPVFYVTSFSSREKQLKEQTLEVDCMNLEPSSTLLSWAIYLTLCLSSLTHQKKKKRIKID